GKVVREALAAGEVLLECRETASERMPPSIDDARVRQQQMNEPHIEAVVRHLVDEERRAVPAMHAGRGEIALCERPDAFGFERLDRREERRLVLVSAGELACDLRHVGQLDRALDLRVTRENLLEQGRARARQADDEDRIARRRTRTSPSLEELPGKEMPAVLDE